MLVGFMGAGKSTVGPLVAQRLGWLFIDTDDYLQKKTGSKIPEIFTSLGEPSFRRMEAEAIAELHHQHQVVLALGGGAIEDESTRSLLQHAEDTYVIFLKASLDVLINRCERQTGAVDRPILQQRDTLASRFHSRLHHYEQADLTIATEGLAPESVAHEIVERLMMIDLVEASNLPSSKVRAKVE